MENVENNKAPERQSLRQILQDECYSMARYAFASGMEVPASVARTLDELSTQGNDEPKQDHGNGDIERLAEAHCRLASLIAPARPRTIRLLESESDKAGWFRFLGAVPLVRQLMLTAVLFLFAFIFIALSPLVNAKVGSGDLLTSSGQALFLNQMFYLSAAGLGASFAALFLANRYIVEGTYDPKYVASYWIRLALGLIAGIILAGLIPIEAGGAMEELGKPTLAMLGGFSAQVVFRILTRLMDTVESLVRGETRDLVKVRVGEAQARALENDVQNRAKLAGQLVRLRDQIAAGADSDVLNQRLDRAMQELMPEIESGATADGKKTTPQTPD